MTVSEGAVQVLRKSLNLDFKDIAVFFDAGLESLGPDELVLCDDFAYMVELSFDGWELLSHVCIKSVRAEFVSW